MNRASYIFTLVTAATALLALAGGCAKSSCPPLKPGTSGVELHVVAEPKNGVQMPTSDDYSGMGEPGAIFPRVQYDDVTDVVAWVEPLGSTATTPPPPPDMTIAVNAGEQRDSDPAIQGVAVGTRLIFQNGGAAAVALFSLSEGNEFDLGSLPPGGRGEYVVRSAGRIDVLAESQSQSLARLYAVPGPWVRTMHTAETACFSDLPPGAYRVACWHERLPGEQRNVTLTPDQRTPVMLKLSVNLLPTKP